MIFRIVFLRLDLFKDNNNNMFLVYKDFICLYNLGLSQPHFNQYHRNCRKNHENYIRATGTCARKVPTISKWSSSFSCGQMGPNVSGENLTSCKKGHHKFSFATKIFILLNIYKESCHPFRYKSKIFEKNGLYLQNSYMC